MRIRHLISQSILPALELLPSTMRSSGAIVQMAATAIQESELKHRMQINGPARSLYQFEKIGILDVLTRRPITARIAKECCERFSVLRSTDEATRDAVYDFFRTSEGDVLSSVFARLNYYNDPRALAPVDGSPKSEAHAWNLYNSIWRPGKPHPNRWPRAYWRAFGCVEDAR